MKQKPTICSRNDDGWRAECRQLFIMYILEDSTIHEKEREKEKEKEATRSIADLENGQV